MKWKSDKMKKIIYDGETVYIGTPKEIKCLYNSIKRACNKSHTNLVPLYEIVPMFDRSKPFYGLKINEDGQFWKVSFEVAALMLYEIA